MNHRNHRVRRGIYVLPTLFTVGNLLCGYSAIVQASLGRWQLAALLIVIAAVLDGLDGRIARLTGTTSEFGVQFDTLADIVSFGVAPAFLVYCWGLKPLGRVGWLIAFLYVICAAMRLARFNIQRAPSDKRYFIGLPSPPAAGVLATAVYGLPPATDNPLFLIGTSLALIAIPLLMVSRVRYRSFKDLDLRSRRSYIYILPLAAMLIAILVRPEIALPVFAASYLVSGPSTYLWGLMRRRGRTVGDRPEVVDGPSVR